MNTGVKSYIFDSKEFSFPACRFLITRNSFQAFLRQSGPQGWLGQTAGVAASSGARSHTKWATVGPYSLANLARLFNLVFKVTLKAERNT